MEMGQFGAAQFACLTATLMSNGRAVYYDFQSESCGWMFNFKSHLQAGGISWAAPQANTPHVSFCVKRFWRGQGVMVKPVKVLSLPCQSGRSKSNGTGVFMEFRRN